MLALSFILTWLVHVIIAESQDIPLNLNFDKELEAEMDKIAEEMLSSFAEAHAEPMHRRTKRQATEDSKSLIDEIGVHRLQTITPVSQLCYPAIYSTFVDVGNTTYAVCVSAETIENPAEVIVGIYKDHVWTPITQWFVVHPNSLSAFHFNGFLYVIVADSGKIKGMDLVKIDLTTNKRKVEYIVHSKPATSISIWKMKADNNFHMAIANLAGHSTDLASDIYVYNWEKTYFDRYSILKAYDVRDIESFYIHDTPYLAIANYRRSINNFEVDSEIFKYNLDKGWTSHQKIRTYGATDWEFFTLGSGIAKEFFLAVANKEENDVSEAKSMIYKFAKDIFVPFQCLPIFRASSLASWSTKTAFLLAVASFDDAVHMFQYDGWRFVQSRIQYTQRAMSLGVNALVFHNITRGLEEIPILSVSNPMHRDLSIFEIGLKHENELQTWTDKSTEWCFNTLQKIESTDTNSLIRALDDVFFIDQENNIVIDGDLYFENGFEVSNLKTPRLKEIVTQEVYDNSILLKLGELNKKLEEMNAKLQVYDEVLKNALKTEGNQTVYGHLTFQDAVLDCEKYTCKFDSINTVYLNGENVTDWSKNLVFLDDENIDGILKADKISATNINVHGLIDGVDSKTLVTKSGQHYITGRKTFVNDVIASEVEVQGTVDGLKISQNDVLLTTGLQNVTGNLIFEEIDTTWLKATSVNNRDLGKFLNDVVRSDQPAVIAGEKTFHDVVVDELHMAEGSTINGVDIADLWENALWKDKDQIITAPMTFESISMEKDLIAPFGINGISIPGPRIVDINGYANITEPQVFTQPIKISHLEVLNSINGLGIQSVEGYPPQLDIMLKSGKQAVTGKKTFHTIHLDADSYVSGTVDGVDLSELKAMTLSKDTPIDTDRTWTFNNLVIKGPLTVNKVSGHNLEDIYERALKLNDTNLPEMTFKKNLEIDDLESYDINGYNFAEDFVLKYKEQTITGTKTFYDIVLEENSIVLSTINNIDMNAFNNTLLRIGNQVLKSKVFNKNVKINKLILKGSINNIPVENLVTLSDDVNLHTRELHNVTFQEIEAGNLEVAGTVNGIDVEEMMKDTLTYGGNQEVKGTLIVKGTINAVPDGNLQVGTINGVNITELYEDAVLIDGPLQEITGEKTFTDSVTFQNLDFKETIDGISEWDMKNWMLRDQPQVVEGNVKFLNDITVDGIQVNGLINGINITELDESIVKTNEPATIEGPVIFKDIVISLDDITLSGNVNGIDFSEEVVTKSGEKVLTGKKTFTKDLVVEGDLDVSGLVDGVSIADICENTLVVKKEQNITHLTIKGDVTLAGGGVIGGKISGIDLEELRHVVALDEDSFVIDGYKVFENLTIEGPITLEGNFGGVNLSELSKTYMSLTQDQIIEAPMKFEEVNIKGTLSASKFDSHDSRVNGINIKDLDERILKKDGLQTITADHYYDEVVFLDDVFVADKVNGLEVPSGLMRRNKPNYIQSPKVFEKTVTVLGDLDITEGKRIQDVDVSDWSKKAVLTEGTFEIAGHKTFNSLEVADVKVDGFLDGLKISDEALLMTYGDQIITGKKTIKGEVEIKGSLTVNGDINGVNLDYLASNTLQHDKENTITGAKHFTKPLTIKSLTAPSVAGVDVVELQKKIKRKLDYGMVQNRLEEINEVIVKVQDALEKQAVVFQYYELFQELEIPRAYSWLYLWNKDCGEILLLADNSSSVDHCSSIRIFKYNEEQKQFLVDRQELQTSYATSMKSLVIEGKTFLFVGNQNPKSICMGGRTNAGNAEIDIYNWTPEGFVLFQSIPTSPIIELGVFSDGLLSCVFVVEMRSTSVYCISTLDDEFTYRETLSTIGCRKADVIKSQGKIVLALAAEDLRPRSMNFIPENNVDVYFWNYEAAMFSKPVQGISSKYIQSLILMDYHTEYSSYLFLAIGGGRIPKLQEEPKITIYRYENSTAKFRKYQDIQAKGELDWLVLQSGELILFALDKERGTVKLFEHKGASGFIHVDTINSIGTISIHPFIRHHDRKDSVNHYLAFAGPHAAMAQPAQGLDYAKILKSKVKGQLYFTEN